MVNHDCFNAFTLRNINDLALASVNTDQVLEEGLVEVGLARILRVEGVKELVVCGVLLHVVVEGDGHTVDVVVVTANENLGCAHKQGLVSDVYDVVHVADLLDLDSRDFRVSVLL